MNIDYVAMSNFKTFQEGIFDFSNYNSGVHLIRGENKQEPELGSNGAGKSTILDALSFCLYGKTLRGLKAKNIRTWNSSGSSSVIVGIDWFEVFRQWNPNKLKINNGDDWQDIDQETLEDVIGLNFDEFKYTVIFGQFNEFFLDLRPSEKLNILDGLFNTSFWDDKSSEANAHKKEKENNANTLLSKLEHLDQEYESKQQELKEKQKRYKSFQEEVDEQIEDLDNEIRELQQDVIALETHLIPEAQEAHRATQLDSEFCEWLYSHYKNEFDTAQYRKREIDLDINQRKKQVQSLEKQMDQFESLEGSQCPQCLQQVDISHTNSHIDELDRQAEALENEIEELEQQKHGYETEALEQQLECYEGHLKELKKHVKECESRIKELERDLDKSKTQLESKQKEMEKLKRYKQENPYSNIIEELEQKLESIKQEYKAEEEDLQKVRSEIDMYDYWVKAFKEIKSYVISSTLSMLEMSVNNTLQSLGMNNWRVRFQVEKESQTGNVQRGFYTIIENPAGEEVAWESYSGGEIQRLRISVSLGIADAISSMKGLDNKFIAFDEPSNYIAQEGIHDLMSVLQSYAKDNGKKVFVIDHHSLTYSFDSETLVVKDRGRSHIS